MDTIYFKKSFSYIAVIFLGASLAGCGGGGGGSAGSADAPPAASISEQVLALSNATPSVEDAVTLSVSGTGSGLQYVWDFGDSQTATGDASSLQHRYAQEGTFTVTVRVTDRAGNAKTASQTITVLPLKPQIVSFAAGSDNQPANATIRFDAGVQGGKSPLSYAWDFGDGTTAQGLSATHNYGKSGTYNLSFTATDATGRATTQNRSWTVSKMSVRFVAGALGGAGSTDGTDARFNTPSALTVASDGSIFVADTDNASIRKISKTGLTSTVAGFSGSNRDVDGTTAEARFLGPTGLAFGPDASLYVIDRTKIRKIAVDGRVSTVAGQATTDLNPFPAAQDGPIATAVFQRPQGLVVNSKGEVLVLDGQAVRKVSGGVVSTLVGKLLERGDTDGSLDVARLNNPLRIAIDGQDNLYIQDGCMKVRRVSADGAVSTLYRSPRYFPGFFGASCPDLSSSGIAVDAAGKISVVENNAVYSVDAGGVATLVAGSTFGERDGLAANAQFRELKSLAVSSSGDLYVTGKTNTVRRVAVDGTVSTLAGLADALSGANVDGTRFPEGSQVAADHLGNTYATDGTCIRMLRLGTFAGVLTGSCTTSGYMDSLPPYTRFRQLQGIAVDSRNNVFVADNLAHVIRKYDASTAEVTTYAGLQDTAGTDDGTLTTARFSNPTQLAMDSNDNLWVADNYGRRLRRITPAGNVQTLAGTPSCSPSVDGQGAQACLSIQSLVVDNQGVPYFGDFYGKVRKMALDGTVSTVVQVINQPILAADGTGTIWVSDSGGYVGRINTDGSRSSFALLRSFTDQLYVNQSPMEFVRSIQSMSFLPNGSLMMIGGGSAFLGSGF